MRSFIALILFTIPCLAQISTTQISMSPGDGIQFTVDGQPFYGSGTFLWPQGSKHTVTVQPIEYGNHPKTQYTFAGWTINAAVSQTWSSTTLVVTADPGIPSIVANFNTLYEFDLVFFSCPTDGTPCLSPGTVFTLPSPCTTPAIQTTSCFVAAGSAVTLLVQPNPGYIFTGWLTSSGSGNSTQSFANSYTMTGPLSVYPQFILSRPVSVQVSTAPNGLQVLEDHTSVSSPANLEWGTGTVHSVSVASPQTDLTGGSWVFSSWSDGGAQNHNYTVPDGYSTLSLSATFVPAYKITLATNPPGLSLTVNGRTNGPAITFTAAAGTQYQLAAPSSQKDAQGRINQFVSWSNGGAQSQTYTQPGYDDRLTATYQTLGHLTLISSPPGLSFIVNGKACVSPCGYDQPPGTQMNITVPASIPLTPASRLDFQGWQDGSSTNRIYTMTSSLQTLSVSYQTMYLVAAASSPTTAGSVLLQPVSPDGFYPANSQLQATVAQNPGFQFRSWQGDLAGAQALASLSISGPKSIGAVFAPVPYLPPAAVQNAAGTTPMNGVAPGSIVSIYGVNLSSGLLAGPTNPLAQTLSNITATLGSQILPLFFVSPQQINVQLPFETDLGEQLLVLHQTGQPDVNAVFSAVRNAPGLFGIAHPDGTAVNATNPAAMGEILTITGTGFGPYDRNPPDGIAIPAGSTFTLLDAVTVTCADVSVTPVSSGPSIDTVGANVIKFEVPGSLPSGTPVPLKVTINGVDSNQLSLFLQ